MEWGVTHTLTYSRTLEFAFHVEASWLNLSNQSSGEKKTQKNSEVNIACLSKSLRLGLNLWSGLQSASKRRNQYLPFLQSDHLTICPLCVHPIFFSFYFNCLPKVLDMFAHITMWLNWYQLSYQVIWYVYLLSFCFIWLATLKYFFSDYHDSQTSFLGCYYWVLENTLDCFLQGWHV